MIALCAPVSLNVKSLGEFIALARAKPDTLNVAAAAGNSDLILRRLSSEPGLAGGPGAVPRHPAGADRPRRGPHPPADVLLRDNAAAGAGRKAQGAGGDQPKRVGIATDIPTVAEAGPYLGLDSLIGMYGPRGMSMRCAKASPPTCAPTESDPTIATRLATSGQVIDLPARPSSPSQIRDQLAAIAQTLGIKAAQWWPVGEPARNLLIVHSSGYEDISDWDEVKRRIDAQAPDIEVRIANNFANSVTAARSGARRWFLRKPSGGVPSLGGTLYRPPIDQARAVRAARAPGPADAADDEAHAGGGVDAGAMGSVRGGQTAEPAKACGCSLSPRGTSPRAWRS